MYIYEKLIFTVYIFMFLQQKYNTTTSITNLITTICNIKLPIIVTNDSLSTRKYILF